MRAVAFLLSIVLAGCDTVAPGRDTAVLTTELDRSTTGSPVVFSFTGNSVGAGSPVDLRCSCRMDVGPFLVEQGFDRGDVVGATATSARVVMGTPTGERLDFLSVLRVRLEPAGVTVAEATSLPAARETTLEAFAGRSVAGILGAGSFEPVLEIEASRLQSGATYQLYLSIAFRIEVGPL